MKQFIYYAFRPVHNRHYTGRKIALWQLAIRYSLLVVICAVGMIIGNTKTFGIILIALLGVMLLDYFVFDALSDKLAWKIYGKRFYGRDVEPISSEHQAMKQFEQTKSPESYEQLEQSLRRK